MSNKMKKVVLAVMMLAVVSGTVLVPSIIPVFAAEQGTDSQQQPAPPPADTPKDDGSGHSGHNHGN